MSNTHKKPVKSPLSRLARSVRRAIRGRQVETSFDPSKLEREEGGTVVAQDEIPLSAYGYPNEIPLRSSGWVAKTYYDFSQTPEFGRVLRGLLEHTTANESQKDDLASFVAFVIRSDLTSEAQLFQDAWALWEADDKRSGYFVEFGAGDGKTLSNTYMLEKERGWTGVIAEPNPDFWDRIRGVRDCTVSTDCVFDTTGGEIEFLAVPVGEFSRVKGVVPEDEHERSGQRDEEAARTIAVPTITLNDLLTQVGAPREIDFLSTDTEGSEYQILAATDLDRWRFRAICVEHNFTPMRHRIHELLTRHGYRRKWAHFSIYDDWYVSVD